MKYRFKIIFCLFLMMLPLSLYARDAVDTYKAGYNGYIFAFPAVVTEMTKRIMTNVSSTQTNGRAPINQFSHAQTLATLDNKDVVRPNNDTLYSSAWLDISKEPIVLSVPDTAGRYYVIPELDAWTEVFESIGKRTTGTTPNNFVMVGPNYQGSIPPGLKVIYAPTSTVWLTGRTLVYGEDDYDNVHAIQQGYKLTPLSQWGSDYIPPSNLPIDPTIDMDTPPLNQINKMTATEFFTMFTDVLKTNPPHPEDSAIMEQLKIIGIVPGKDFDPSQLSIMQMEELNRAVINAWHTIELYLPRLGNVENGWIFPKMTGTYGSAYLDRASIAYIGLGANIALDSLYPSAFTDTKNNTLTGSNRYILHFNKNNIPPANGFWSVTLYGPNNYFVPNPINRYSLGDRSNMKYNPDGSLDIYIQYASPGKEKESNWLPSPEGNFDLMLRDYWPKDSALNGQWKPNGVTKL